MLPPCTQFETSLAEETARFAWHNPVDRDRTNDSSECFFGAPEPRDFVCETIVIESVVEGQDITTLAAQLSRRNAAVYDEVCLYRDGQIFTALPGGCKAFVDREAAPGSHSYEIRARIGVSRSCRVRVDCTIAPPSSVFRRGDVDSNMKVEITDAVKLLGYLFLGSSAPPAPGPTECGTDPLPEDNLSPCAAECKG